MMNSPTKRQLLLALCIGSALAFTGPLAWAQTGSFGKDPFAQGESTGDLVKELNTLLDKGEKERLIDPWFLRDLRTTIGKYDHPWSQVLLRDDFSARGPQPDAPWQVTTGEFLIDWRHGLRSVIDNNTAAQSSQTGSQGTGDKDIGKALLGALLQGALKGGSKSDTTQQQAPATASFAAVQAPLALSNAFSIEMTISLRQPANGTVDGFEYGPYQGANAGTGYRLSYVASDNSLQLLRVTSRGVATIDVARLAGNLADEQNHQFSWTRDRDGGMTIKVDGADAITVTDQSFRDAFDGVAILNRGGDFAIREVTVAGVPN